MTKEMYVGGKESYNKASWILTQLDKTKNKSMEFFEIRASLYGMKKCLEDNPNSPIVLPMMIGWENEMNYETLSNFQQIRENLERNLKFSLGICSKLHRETTILFRNYHLCNVPLQLMTH